MKREMGGGGERKEGADSLCYTKRKPEREVE